MIIFSSSIESTCVETASSACVEDATHISLGRSPRNTPAPRPSLEETKHPESAHDTGFKTRTMRRRSPGPKSKTRSFSFAVAHGFLGSTANKI